MGQFCQIALDALAILPYNKRIKRDAFLRDLRRYCRDRDLEFSFTPREGKGGHGRVRVGESFTTVQTDLTPGRIESILKQLGLPKDAI